MGVVVEVAKGVASLIESSSASMKSPAARRAAQHAERSWADWRLPLEKVTSYPRLDVVPVNSSDLELDDRGHLAYRPSVDLCLRKKFGMQDSSVLTGRIAVEEVDELVDGLQEILELFTGPAADMRLAGGLDAAWHQTDLTAWYLPKHLRDARQYTGIVRVTYEVTKGR